MLDGNLYGSFASNETSVTISGLSENVLYSVGVRSFKGVGGDKAESMTVAKNQTLGMLNAICSLRWQVVYCL